MAYRALDLTLISAQELKNVNIITKLHAYAVATLSDDTKTEQRTPTDRLGGHNPTWDHTYRFLIPADVASASRLFVHVLVRSRRLFGDRTVGGCRIPLKDLISSDGVRESNDKKYLIRKDGSKKIRGILKISYKLGELPATAPVSTQQQTPETSTRGPSMLSGYASPYELASVSQYGTYSPSSYGYGYYPQSSSPAAGYGSYGSPYGASMTFGYPLSTYGYGYYPQQDMNTPNENDLRMGRLGAGFLGGGLLVDDMILEDAVECDAPYNAGFAIASKGSGFDD